MLAQPCAFSTPPSTRPCRAPSAARCTCRRWPKGLAALGHEVHTLVARGARRVAGRAGALARHRSPGAAARSFACWLAAQVAPHGPRRRARSGDRALSQLRRRGHAGGARRGRAGTCSRSTRRSSTTRDRPSRGSTARSSCSRCGGGATRQVRAADLIVSPSAQILPGLGAAPTACSRSSGAQTPSASTRRPAATLRGAASLAA